MLTWGTHCSLLAVPTGLAAQHEQTSEASLRAAVSDHSPVQFPTYGTQDVETISGRMSR